MSRGKWLGKADSLVPAAAAATWSLSSVGGLSLRKTHKYCTGQKLRITLVIREKTLLPNYHVFI